MPNQQKSEVNNFVKNSCIIRVLLTLINLVYRIELNFCSLGASENWNRPKKVNEIYFSKCDTPFYINLSRAFQKYRFVAFVIKRLCGLFLFYRPDFNTLSTTLYKNSLISFILKLKNFNNVSIRTVGAKKLKPPPSLSRVNLDGM